MFSLHVDTARSWRGGQNQVLLTVLGLRALGHRTALVAHPDGELHRRAAEGPDLIPIAASGEMGLGAAWQLSRVLKALRPTVVHAHDAHAVAMVALARTLGRLDPLPRFVVSRRVDFHIRRNAFSRWKYGQVELFLCASNAIQSMLVGDGVSAARVVTVHEGVDLEHIAAAPPLDIHAELWLPSGTPIVGNVAALVPHKGHRYLIKAAAIVVRQIPDTRFVILGKGELEPVLRKHIKDLHLERHILLAGFRPDVLSLQKGFDLFAMSSLTEGLGTALLDAMAIGQASSPREPVASPKWSPMTRPACWCPRAMPMPWPPPSCSYSATQRGGRGLAPPATNGPAPPSALNEWSRRHSTPTAGWSTHPA